MRLGRRSRGMFARTLVVATVAVLGSPLPGEAQADPAVVARALIDAENRHDIEGAVALFADDAVINDARGRLTTRAEIRQWQTDLAAGNFRATMGDPSVSGDRVTFTGTVALDSLRALGFQSLEASWTLTVQQGRIKVFDFAFSPEANARLQQARAGASELPRTGVGALDLVAVSMTALALGAVLLGAARWRRTPPGRVARPQH